MAIEPNPHRLARFEFLGSARFINALTTVIVGMAASTFLIERLSGWAGLNGILATLVVLAAASAFMRRQSLDWKGILPISLLAYTAWLSASFIWSGYHLSSFSSVLYQLSFTLLAVFIALTRDMIQIVRVFGNVLRAFLAASVIVEIFAGLLIDSPIRFLGIRGNLAEVGPIQGLAGDSARLGIFALVAGITFVIEMRTRSVRTATSIGSLVTAVLVILLSQSNVVMAIGIGVAIIAVVLVGIRRVSAHLRLTLSWIVLAFGVILAALGVAFRSSLLEAFDSSDQVTNRIDLWQFIFQFTVATNNIEGWGWIGRWRTDITPFYLFDVSGPFASAYNAFLDLWLQVGFVGVALFFGLIALALTRSWLLAVRQVSVIYLWPALIVIGLIATAVTESAILIDFGWLTLVICVVKSANKLSWRVAFESLNPRLTAPELRER